MSPKTNRVLILGNAAGGKTRLARLLAESLELPLFHIDSVQFLPGMKLRPLTETRNEIREWLKQKEWIIDGYGPLDLLEERMDHADLIVFVDHPLWRHYFWAGLRVFKNIYSRRSELAPGCSENSFPHVLKLFKTIHQIHSKMRPEMLRWLAKPKYQGKVQYVRSVSDFGKVLQDYGPGK